VGIGKGLAAQGDHVADLPVNTLGSVAKEGTVFRTYRAEFVFSVAIGGKAGTNKNGLGAEVFLYLIGKVLMQIGIIRNMLVYLRKADSNGRASGGLDEELGAPFLKVFG